MPHIHFLLTLDWEEQKRLWKGNGKELTEERYIEEYICAEIPPLPAEGDTSHAAYEMRRYHNIVMNKMYHRCMTGYCRKTAQDPCNKRFPVRFSLFSFVYKKNFSYRNHSAMKLLYLTTIIRFISDGVQKMADKYL